MSGFFENADLVMSCMRQKKISACPVKKEVDPKELWEKIIDIWLFCIFKKAYFNLDWLLGDCGIRKFKVWLWNSDKILKIDLM